MATVKYSGPVASFHCPTEATIRSLKVHFSPKQEGSGDPSPENVRPIVGWDGVEVYRNDSTINYEFGVLGKNKCPLLTLSKNEIVELGGWQSDNTTMRLVIDNLVPSTDYTLSCLVTSQLSGGTQDRLYLRGTTEGFINLDTYPQSRQSITKTSRANGTIDITINHTFSKDASRVSEVVDIQLELGSTATAYEPYDPNRTVYGGWVDLISGEVCEEWLKEHIDENTTNFTYTSRVNNNGIYFYRSVLNNVCSLSASQLGSARIQEFYSHGIIANPYTSKELCMWVYTPDNKWNITRFSFPDEMNINSMDDFHNWLVNVGGVDICYPLKIPNTYHLAPIQLQTFLSQNNIWSNADYVEVEYDLHETQNILARK